MEYVLIVAMWAGALSTKDSIALTSVGGFTSLASCDLAGKEAVNKFTTVMKTVSFVCAKR